MSLGYIHVDNLLSRVRLIEVAKGIVWLSRAWRQTDTERLRSSPKELSSPELSSRACYERALQVLMRLAGNVFQKSAAEGPNRQRTKGQALHACRARDVASRVACRARA